jgi:hypothetical protein
MPNPYHSLLQRAYRAATLCFLLVRVGSVAWPRLDWKFAHPAAQLFAYPLYQQQKDPKEPPREACCAQTATAMPSRQITTPINSANVVGRYWSTRWCLNSSHTTYSSHSSHMCTLAKQCLALLGVNGIAAAEGGALWTGGYVPLDERKSWDPRRTVPPPP